MTNSKREREREDGAAGIGVRLGDVEGDDGAVGGGDRVADRV